MKKFSSFLLLILCLFLFKTAVFAGPGDTLVVQTYTFEAQNNPNTDYDSPGRRWFQLPENDGTTYQKILMKYTLKCFEDGTAGGLGFACGEWDYTSHTFLFEHTGQIDSNLVSHPLYLANNQDFDSISFHQEPYANYLSESLYASNVTTTISEDIYSSNLGNESLDFPFGDVSKHVRSQFLWTADELIALGMQAGDIDGLELDFIDTLSNQNVIKIRLKNTTTDELVTFENGDFTEVYYWDMNVPTAGDTRFQFAEPFAWDGTSNVLVEILSEPTAGNGGSNLQGGESGFSSALVSAGNDGYLEVGQNDEVKIPPAVFETLDTEVTISFWSYGDPDILPENTYAFEGVNENHQRVLNAHLPWNNGRIYWDAGWNGGYDRIDKQASASDYKGNWTHWAFTKNTTTGVMKIFKNGQQWHIGTDKNNSVAGVVEFSIAHSLNSSSTYFGKIDEFQIWDKELTEEEIANWQYKDIDSTHPEYSHLRAYYQFNEENDQPVYDSSPNGFTAYAHGSPNRIKYRASELFRNITSTSIRPNVNFVSGEYESSLLESSVLIEIPVAPISVSTWEVQGNSAVISEVNYYWPVGASTVVDEEGQVLETTENPADLTLINATFDYYEPPYEVVNRWELGRFITPYGIQLDLEDGWTWTYDVSDFVTLLHDSVELDAGNWQELLDLKFLFIEGTPPRDVKRIEQPWHGNWDLNTWQDNVLPQTYSLAPDETMAKINVTTSGHWFGQGNNCAEFCNNIHDIEVNGEPAYSWQIIQECANNPLYPQGGTWIYDRAGWCPGAPVTRRDFELTDYITNNELTVDYNVSYDPYGNYWLTGHLVTFGDPNFENDVELNDIISPSNEKVKSRRNRICNQPVIRIRNNGSQPLTSCVISYGVGGQMQDYEWTGNLEFMETEEVVLTYGNSTMWEGDEEELLTFHVEVSLPNGQVDENPFNGSGNSKFYRPERLAYPDLDDNRIIFRLKTNNAYLETSWDLHDMAGDLIFERSDFTESNTVYNDTIALQTGCYYFHVADTDDDGLSFFANNDGGGYVKLKKVGGAFFKSFNPNFGKEIDYAFYWETDVASVEERQQDQPTFEVFPNPTNDRVNLMFTGFDNQVKITISTLSRKVVYQEDFTYLNATTMKPIDCSKFAPGMYLIKVEDGNHQMIKKVFVE